MTTKRQAGWWRLPRWFTHPPMIWGGPLIIDRYCQTGGATIDISAAHAESTCYECEAPLVGPVCPACNPPGAQDVERARILEAVAAGHATTVCFYDSHNLIHRLQCLRRAAVSADDEGLLVYGTKHLADDVALLLRALGADDVAARDTPGDSGMVQKAEQNQ